ncbi:hypothetical protein TNCT_594221 [Trichonephila clavata]|uniref:Uncharacterized protein n=1 Tax=Trichonephila clavata TaxID=2740835 RepID=A0A8X6HYE3_TRICU|nr:hypothetical protein TNCT_594221 [Trichonephila clavata]
MEVDKMETKSIRINGEKGGNCSPEGLKELEGEEGCKEGLPRDQSLILLQMDVFDESPFDLLDGVKWKVEGGLLNAAVLSLGHSRR